MEHSDACSTEEPWCLRGNNADGDLLKPHITLDLIARIGACGVACKGSLAKLSRQRGLCGLTSALIESIAWAELSERVGYDDALDTAVQIMTGQVEPYIVIKHPPEYLCP